MLEQKKVESQQKKLNDHWSRTIMACLRGINQNRFPQDKRQWWRKPQPLTDWPLVECISRMGSSALTLMRPLTNTVIAGCISLPLFTYCSYYHWGHIALLNTEVLAIIDFQSDFYHLFLTILINDYRLARAIYSTD